MSQRPMPISSGVLKGNLDGGGMRITNLADPVNDGDAATKRYVNEHGGGTVSWSDVTGKPSSFPPSAHTHQQTEVSGLPAALSALGDAVAGKRDKTDLLYSAASWNLQPWIDAYNKQPTPLGIIEASIHYPSGYAIAFSFYGYQYGELWLLRGRNEPFSSVAEAEAATTAWGWDRDIGPSQATTKSQPVNLALTTEIPTAAERSALAGLIQRVQSLNPATSTIADIITALKGN